MADAHGEAIDTLAGSGSLTADGDRLVAGMRASVEQACPLDLRVHTNGVRLDERFCEVFLAVG